MYVSVISKPLACKLDCHILHDSKSLFIRSSFSHRMYLFMNENWMFRMKYETLEVFCYLKF